MADEIDVLLEKVEDPALRADLRTEIGRVRAKRSFGLVFESHLPERVRLPDHPVRRGVKVVDRDADGESRLVRQVGNGSATVIGSDGSIEDVEVSDLVVIAEFGETIYPGFTRLGSIEQGGDKPGHIVINGENHHALEALQFTHAGKIDCIYIDPPYNSGARDWKYDNNYVDAEDGYRHSKWLAFMDRRLKLAKQLLNPDDSVLIVTIDEKEYMRLGLLLEQIFPSAVRQMATIVINPLGQARKQQLARVDEFVFFVFLGRAAPAAGQDDLLTPEENDGQRKSRKVRWEWLLRGGTDSRRSDSPNLFYPIFIDPISRTIVDVGEPLLPEIDRRIVEDRDGCVTIWPIKRNGDEGRWRASPSYLLELLEAGYAKVGAYDKINDRWSILYLGKAQIKRIKQGELKVVGRNDDRSVQLEAAGSRSLIPKTVWNRSSHRADEHGTSLLKRFLPDRSFPFPKSLYAVEDALRIGVSKRPDAVVLDFFAGSGTTAHAVMRLNREDAGRRQSISVTNNEVSVDESRALRQKGYLPGDPEWEALGIFDQIARPRITAAVLGVTPTGEDVKGDYKFGDEFPMSEGFEENVEFLELCYLDPVDVELDRAFAAIAPMLWMRAGGVGPMIWEVLDESCQRKPYAFTGHYGVLFNTDVWRAFVNDLPETAKTAFVVTDSSSTFAGVAEVLPEGVEAVRLYENYLMTFAINQGW
ncbi:MAG: site-specific DNA-methyltransferase [Acidimicrobiia bacterium]|nr:site-specific DNA-methyltransferase [Acidimicrobiia bacterium]MYG59995.1 site-specific DNA-methyltransferase [Acidimicrobiia bacterium]MYJ33677.1 site-specific DNA-methyltransferase [Acidimicrobiia bacterium]